MPSLAGHRARLSYLWEDDGFASAPTDDDHKPFGADATLDTLQGTNNAVEVFQPNSREAAEIIEQNFQGSWSVSFTLTNPWWLAAVISSASTAGSTEPYTHTYDGDIPNTMQLVQGTEQVGSERILKGCIVTSAEISTQVGGMVEVSLDGAYADEELLEGANLVEQPVIQYRPLHFGHATLKDTDATYSLVQNVSVSIENNVDLIQEIGTRTAVDYSPKIRSTSLSWSDITEDDSELKDMYGGNTSVQETVENTSDVTVLFDNRKSGADKNTLQIDLDGVFQNEYGRSGVGDPEADLQGSMTGMTVGVTVTAENDQAEAR